MRILRHLQHAVWVIIPEPMRDSGAYKHALLTYRITPPHHFFSHFKTTLSVLGLPVSQMVPLPSVLNTAWAPRDGSGQVAFSDFGL